MACFTAGPGPAPVTPPRRDWTSGSASNPAGTAPPAAADTTTAHGTDPAATDTGPAGPAGPVGRHRSAGQDGEYRPMAFYSTPRRRGPGWMRSPAARRADRDRLAEQAAARHAAVLAAAHADRDRWRSRAIAARDAVVDEHAEAMRQLGCAAARRGERDTWHGVARLAVWCLVLTAAGEHAQHGGGVEDGVEDGVDEHQALPDPELAGAGLVAAAGGGR